MAETRQLPLDLPVAARMGEEDWVTSQANRAAVEMVARFPDWPSDVVAIVGPQGAGKTHLARLFAERTGATIVAAADLAARDPLALVAAPAVVLEDAGPATDARALFHLLNAVRQAGRRLLVTTTTLPAAWPVALPDLASRLRAVPPIDLGEPDDELLEALLAKLFADRQTVVDPAVVAFLARRMERSFAAAHALVAALDRVALAAKSPITRPIAARVLAGGFDRAPHLPGLDASSTADDDLSWKSHETGVG